MDFIEREHNVISMDVLMQLFFKGPLGNNYLHFSTHQCQSRDVNI